MNNPDSYIKYHRLQYRDNMRCLAENIGRLKWKTVENEHGQDKNGLNGKNEGDAPINGLDTLHNGLDTLHNGLDTLHNGLDTLHNGLGTLHDGLGTLHNGLSNNRWKDLGRVIRVLDVGSGDGRFTSEELRRALPPNCEITGCDKSPAMVDHANAHHAGNGVKFELVEIGKPLLAHYIGAFDHIFSFFCYHWIPDHKVAFSQTYDMLTDGGDCLLLMVAYFPIVYDVYRWFSRSKRWSKYVYGLDPLTSPYHGCEDPEMKLIKFAEEAGFKDIYVKNIKSTYTYASEQDIKNMMTSLNPFQIPEELMEEYLEEFIRVAKAEGYLSDTLTINYSTNTIYARKY